MGLFDSIKDYFNNAEFSIAPNKKLKTISTEFKNAFNLSLIFYKGNMIADGDLTLAGLNRRTSKEVNTTSKEDIKIKGSMKVKDVEDLFEKTYGVKVQIKDATGKTLINNDFTLGKGSRL
jgi:hypothetical protein